MPGADRSDALVGAPRDFQTEAQGGNSERLHVVCPIGVSRFESPAGHGRLRWAAYGEACVAGWVPVAVAGGAGCAGLADRPGGTERSRTDRASSSAYASVDGRIPSRAASGMSSRAVLDVRVYTTVPPMKYALAPGTDSSAAEMRPPALDSQTSMV